MATASTDSHKANTEMSVIYITLSDTEDGMVSVETIVHGYNKASNAVGMANRINAYMGQIAQDQAEPAKPEPQSIASKIVGANGLRLVGV